MRGFAQALAGMMLLPDQPAQKASKQWRRAQALGRRRVRPRAILSQSK